MSRMAMMQELAGDIKRTLMTLHRISSDAEECVDLLQTAFVYNSSRHLDSCRQKVLSMLQTLHAAAKDIEVLAGDHPMLKPYASVYEHLVVIGKDIEKLAGLVERKICEGILFSHRAGEEVTFLMQRLTDLLGPTADIILARNEILGNYIRESEREIIKSAMEYATIHEERLIGGVCQPMASPLYLEMLDAIKNIAWNVREIAVKLTR
jgi:hypothetical protein